MKKQSELNDSIEKVYLTNEQIQERVQVLGKKITEDFSGQELVVVGILKGAFIFMADLCRNIDLPMKVDFMSISSYGNSFKSSGNVKVEKDLSENIEDKNVLIVEDIIDTGLTMSHVVEMLKLRRPKQIKVCVLFTKPTNNKRFVNIDYCGFDLDDKFVVGYGLDYCGYLRNLPFIGVAKTN